VRKAGVDAGTDADELPLVRAAAGQDLLVGLGGAGDKHVRRAGDRKKEVVIRCGLNVYPREIEEVM
jgi:acyl-CoA synthetase (AMP-forming)/AMP-acid ligase II